MLIIKKNFFWVYTQTLKVWLYFLILSKSVNKIIKIGKFIFQIQSSKSIKYLKKRNVAKWKNKRLYTPFPPAQSLSKIDLQLESGEYFLNELERREQKSQKMKTKQIERKIERKKLRSAKLIPPLEPLRSKLMNMQENTKKNNKFDLNKFKKKIKNIK